ncbi:hypothetical protein [Microlunatus flavus]|uniref:Uncharacterized protein n=1 Tax=Microlunatus flavus TaxID=1036181 RepID=A0A1H8ZDX2_9ACTN|nr:hypothetical protein [Microlunatus flavus]SEP62619.1 hypothetical protein SAMN05421756_101207 [Microlunatus flavus]
MTRSKQNIPAQDSFGLWYRFKALVVFNLLYVAGPAQLDGRQDPRKAVEHDYERRRDLHRARRGLPPVVKEPPTKGGLDVVVLLAAGGGVALVLLLVWAILSSR